MKRFFYPASLIPACLMLWGCPPPSGLASIPKTEDSSSGSLVAQGYTPQWSMQMDTDRYTLKSAELGIEQSGKTANGQQIDGRTTRYDMGDTVIDLIDRVCVDPVDQTRYYYTLSIVAAGQELNGCGGVQLPVADLNQTRWQGLPIAEDLLPRTFDGTLEFDNGRLFGTTGCNRFSGSYRIENMTLITGPLAVTRMACTGKRGRFETRMLGILGKPAQIFLRNDGSIELFAEEIGGISFRRLE